MCYSLYLFTDKKLETSSFDEKNPGMYIDEIRHASDEPAKKWKGEKEYIYYIGSQLCCGCGWIPVTEYDDDDLEEVEGVRKDRESLYAFLKNHSFEDSYLIIAWEGNQGKPLIAEKVFDMELLKDVYFEFEELVMYKLP